MAFRAVALRPKAAFFLMIMSAHGRHLADVSALAYVRFAPEAVVRQRAAFDPELTCHRLSLRPNWY
jgi:hypothetical protein